MTVFLIYFYILYKSIVEHEVPKCQYHGYLVCCCSVREAMARMWCGIKASRIDYFVSFCSWSCITPSCIGTTSAKTTWTNPRRMTTAPERRSSTARRGRAKTPNMLWWRSASTAMALNQSGWLSTGYSTTGGCSQFQILISQTNSGC